MTPSGPHRRRGEKGTAALEFGLIAPLLLMLVFGVVDFGWMLMKAHLVNDASRDAVRVASLDGSYAEIRSTLDEELASSGISEDDVVVSITCTAPDGSTCSGTEASYDANAVPGATVQVSVSYTHGWLTPFGALCDLAGNDSCVGTHVVIDRTSSMVRE